MLGIGPIDLDRLPEIRRQLEDLIRRILEDLPATKVILHGSFATERVHQRSDVDIIVVADVPERFFDRADRVHALNEDRLPIEVLCYTPDEFERMLTEKGSLVARAVATGCVYERA